MASNAQVGISNKMSDDISPGEAFDMPLATADPVLTAGTVQVKPTDVITSLNPTKNTNGGVYAGSADHLVRGAVAYTIPGAKAKLIIYFDTNKCRLDTVAPDVSITADIVKATETKNHAKVTGALVVGSDVYTYTAKAESNLVGDTNQCLVSIVAAGN
ncbi:hypothetical protein DFH08DRAFT_813908 [Mycena albidolilacea]|uniref:Uncharacterized protein n=1 Tax=Mycena albidolilacea TaxID=1033008 RepID=A0AAD6ZR31_9AGAR|nr:hypothetical protein DFH08DRAFT_813908 [Mycena albidolilacea]